MVAPFGGISKAATIHLSNCAVAFDGRAVMVALFEGTLVVLQKHLLYLTTTAK